MARIGKNAAEHTLPCNGDTRAYSRLLSERSKVPSTPRTRNAISGPIPSLQFVKGSSTLHDSLFNISLHRDRGIPMDEVPLSTMAVQPPSEQPSNSSPPRISPSSLICQ